MAIIKNPREYWTKEVRKKLIGKKIVDVQYLSEASATDGFGFMGKMPVIIYFHDRSWIVPMMDDEGNDGGALATSFEDLETIPVIY